MNNILRKNERGSLIVISGPSGSGKDTICERLKEYKSDFWVSVSCTCLLYTSPSPRDRQKARMPSSA